MTQDTVMATRVAEWIERDERLEDLERAYIGTLLALSDAADARTEYRPGHARRSGELAAHVARALGLPEDQIEAVRYGAILHDVGQISVPEEILRSPCPPTVEEWRLIRGHPAAGAQMVAAVPRLAHIAEIVRAHHERWDGRGYPLGLRGEQIPVGARIVAVVDAYLAMIEDRPYQFARTPREAMAEVERRAGTQFDPHVVDAFAVVMARCDVPADDGPDADDRTWQPLRDSLRRLVRATRARQGAAHAD
ncbi:MAG: HD-GYP domain-containing protein [Armatimonadota bacterium]|nr:HD-GYP domain-containing protein [Armatimonadota bacterium]MDR7485688.1 HD-GYP domain-containing protein [Armatimonadota bacterium]MDR7533081.1 HD-GYP domain-containing protein [Armatimonadota bacterium]MDR7535887.1 HD-GYP domain-containing protein [Armatimonadota bacterium]